MFVLRQKYFPQTNPTTTWGRTSQTINPEKSGGVRACFGGFWGDSHILNHHFSGDYNPTRSSQPVVVICNQYRIFIDQSVMLFAMASSSVGMTNKNSRHLIIPNTPKIQ